jgi:hypothetical protein
MTTIQNSVHPVGGNGIGFHVLFSPSALTPTMLARSYSRSVSPRTGVLPTRRTTHAPAGHDLSGYDITRSWARPDHVRRDRATVRTMSAARQCGSESPRRG